MTKTASPKWNRKFVWVPFSAQEWINTCLLFIIWGDTTWTILFTIHLLLLLESFVNAYKTFTQPNFCYSAPKKVARSWLLNSSFCCTFGKTPFHQAVCRLFWTKSRGRRHGRKPFKYIYIYIYIYRCMCIYTYVCIYIYTLCVYIHIFGDEKLKT